jgi:4-hydroxybenzoate polyprenyltransferase
MSKLFNIIKLLRPQQWYKNVVIFAAIFFSGDLLNINQFYLTFLGFISLCLISSTNYIINDLVDCNKDKKHPEKKNRPIASGIVKKSEAIIIAIFTFTLSVWNAFYLPKGFFYIIIALFISTQIYSLFLKNEAFLDVILIGTNFVLRAVSGTFIIKTDISPWLIICAFFLALFLGFGKRIADLKILGEKAKEHKAVFKIYTEKLLNSIVNSIIAIIITTYSLYTFFKEGNGLILTLPIVVYALFRYYYLINSGSIIARHPDKAFKDVRLILSMLLWGIIVFISLYII